MMTWLRQSLKIVGNTPPESKTDVVLDDCDGTPMFAHQPLSRQNAIGTAAADLALALTAAEWERIKDSDDITRLMRFAAYFPGYYSEVAYERVLILQNQHREDDNWLWSEQQSTAPAYLRYLAAWPNGRYVQIAQSRLIKLGFPDARSLPAQHVRPNNRALTPAATTDRTQHTEFAASRDQIYGGETGKQGLAFRDAPTAPELVAVPAGSFLMGADDDSGRLFERPVRPVTIAHRLAVGRFPVTFEEWDHAVSAGAIAYQPGDEGWGRGRRPVINVSWHEAKLYAAWLSQLTGYDYRLLTEAEWEYCCRAGTREAYATGAHILPSQANFSAKEWGSAGQSSEVGSFEPNNFGLYEMHGNVSEWVEDDWSASYVTSSNDGLAVKTDTGTLKITRGGGWPDLPGALRSACRNPLNPKTRNNSTGLRVVRTLWPTTR